MADKASILQNAQRYMAKGQLDKAIDEWQKLISESPNDGNIHNTIGDLLLKKNDLAKAVEAYLKGAEVFHAAGFALKTIAIYKKLIKLVPQRLDILIKLGDLNAERGLVGNAVEDYLSAAKQYAQGGFVREALEVYRKIANQDPTNTAIRLKLADLCLKEGLQQEAVDEYLKIAESYRERNQLKEAESLYERILNLDPENETARKNKGMAAALQDAPSMSRQEFLSQIDGLIEKERFDEARKLLDPFIEQNPDDPAGPHRLGTVHLKAGRKEEAFGSFKFAARHYMDRSEYGQAGKLMKDYLEADPDRFEAHMLLAEAYERGGNPHLAVSAYAHVIDEYLVSGETSQAREMYFKIKGLEPQHRDVRRLRHSFELSEASQPHIVLPETDRLPETRTEYPPASPPETGATQTAPEEVAPAVEAAPIVDPAALHSLFTEAEVYLKYGLSAKAIEQFEQILAMDSENEKAHQQLKDIYKSEGQTGKAVEACFRLMEIYKKAGDMGRRADVLEEAKSLDPENPRIREATDLAPILESGRMKAILSDEQLGIETAPPPPSEADRAEREAKPKEAPPAEISSGLLQEKEDVAEQMAEADFYYQQGLRDEAKKMYELILALQPDHEAAQEKLEAIATEEALEKEMNARKTEAVTPAAETVPAAQPPLETKAEILQAKEIGPAKARSADEKMLDEELEKTFAPFMGRDTEESDAVPQETGRPSSKEAAGTVDLESLLKEEEAPKSGAAQEVPASGAVKEPKEEFVDLSGMLNEEAVKGDRPDAEREESSVSEQLNSIFSEFQKDAEQVDDIDYETHYNLGIAYKEMGLLNEAILEFKQAMNGPDRFIDASNMLAACHRESGHHRDAIRILEQALADPRCDEAQGRWLRYDLASLHEKESRLEEALDLFTEIARSDPNFKDVVQRVETLEGRLGKPKRKAQIPKASEDQDEDVDAMMERIFGESSPETQTKSGKAGHREGSKDDAKKKDRISYL